LRVAQPGDGATPWGNRSGADGDPRGASVDGWERQGATQRHLASRADGRRGQAHGAGPTGAHAVPGTDRTFIAAIDEELRLADAGSRRADLAPCAQGDPLERGRNGSEA